MEVKTAIILTEANTDKQVELYNLKIQHATEKAKAPSVHTQI